jgi:glyoxylase-like metal-dependent hydrolase (beta-lactamase superfamily II)
MPAANAQSLDSARIVTEQVGDGLYVLFGVGEGVIAGNIVASIGAQGVLIVDDQFPEIAPKYKAAIREAGGADEIAFAINTHWHFDHADGNKALGPEGTWLVSHESSRQMLMRDNVINLVSQTRQQPAFPPEALPVVTYDRSMHMHFNGERIDLMHFGPAHTTGDTAVIFRGRNVVHLGDVFNAAGYPFIDADNGGTLAGIVEFCRAVLGEIDAGTVVVPGHGPVSDYEDLADYVTMLGTIHDRIEALVESGATLEQVVAARPTAEWDEAKGNPANFIDRAYASLTRP